MIAARPLTETEARAHDRRRAFHEKIAAHAAALEAPKEPPAPVHSPRTKKPWFSIVGMVPGDHPSIAEIQAVVCDYYGISRGDICSARRQKEIVLPRHVAVYLCKELTPFSLPVIGRRFGQRNHTTILSGVRKITRLVYCDQGIAFDVAALVERLTGEA